MVYPRGGGEPMRLPADPDLEEDESDESLSDPMSKLNCRSANYQLVTKSTNKGTFHSCCALKNLLILHACLARTPC